MINGKTVWFCVAFAAFFLCACANKNVSFVCPPQADILEGKILAGDVEGVKKILTPSLASSCTKKKVPLIVLASAYGKKEIVTLLLDKGAFIHAADEKNNTALHVAAGKDYVEIVEILLKRGADINAAGYYGRTPIMEAGRCGSRKVFDLLLEKGADIHKKDELKRTLLMYVCMGAEDQNLMVKKLLEKGAEKVAADHQGRLPVVFAGERKHTKSALLLLDGYKDFSEEGNFAIGLVAMRGAIRGKDKELAGYILDKKLPLNWNERTIRTLLRRINASGIYRLMARNELMDIKRAPLLYAAKENNLEMVKFLLANGADIMQKDEKGYDALSLATERNIVSFLKKEKGKKVKQEKNGRKKDAFFKGKILGN
ncbi:MAG: ankyrin repeat domain-containing protein [Lentisphaeria bacterium]|nr:ankyrin repeat domain-containing protein [Lentisphaeria bacterium]